MNSKKLSHFAKILTIIIIIAFIPSLDLHAENWSIIESDHFLVRYIQDIKSAQEIQNIAEEFFPEVSNNLGYSTGRKIDIWFCETRKEFNRTNNAPIQDWAAGVAYPLQARVVLLNPILSEYKRLDLERLVKHEVTHVVFGLCIGENLNNVPRWFNEGVAMYESDDWGYGNYWAILTGTIGNSIIPLFNISEDFPVREYQARLAYAESYSIISFISKRYGDEAIKGCIRELAKGRTFDEALASATGASLDWIESRWLKDLRKRYKWFSLLSSGLVLWGGATFILWIAYFRRKWKNRKIIKRWEDEERGLYWLDFENKEPEELEEDELDEEESEEEYDDDDENKT
jgi:hypothetical protein